MHRMNADRTLKVISVDVEGIMNGTTPDMALQNEDILFIPTKSESQTERTITIHGEVQYPGRYRYADNETLEDFVLQAGGLKETASTVKVDVTRRIYDSKATTTDSLIAHTYSFALNPLTKEYPDDLRIQLFGNEILYQCGCEDEAAQGFEDC